MDKGLSGRNLQAPNKNGTGIALNQEQEGEEDEETLKREAEVQKTVKRMLRIVEVRQELEEQKKEVPHYCLQKITRYLNHVVHLNLFISDPLPHFKTKRLPLEPILQSDGFIRKEHLETSIEEKQMLLNQDLNVETNGSPEPKKNEESNELGGSEKDKESSQEEKEVKVKESEGQDRQANNASELGLPASQKEGKEKDPKGEEQQNLNGWEDDKESIYLSQASLPKEVTIQALEGHFIEVIDMDDEEEPLPAPIDHYATNHAKIKKKPKKVGNKMNVLVKALMWKAHNMMVESILDNAAPGFQMDEGPFNSHDQSVISVSPSGKRMTMKHQSQIDLLKLFEQSKASHLLDRGHVGKQVQLPEMKKKEENPLYKLTEAEELEVSERRRKLFGEEKKLLEEIKKAKEIDQIYESINQKGSLLNQGKEDITFDYEGNIMQVKKIQERDMIPTIQQPRIKLKQAVVKGNYILEAVERQKLQVIKNKQAVDPDDEPPTPTAAAAMKAKAPTPRQPTPKEEKFTLKKSDKKEINQNFSEVCPDLFIKYAMRNLTSMNISKPMGSNFNDMIPSTGITISEKGRTKQGNQGKKGPNKLTKEEYKNIKQNNSLTQMAEERLGKQDQSRSFSLPQLHGHGDHKGKKYTDISGIHGSSMDYSKTVDQSLMQLSRSLSKGNIQKVRQEAEQEVLDLEGKKQQLFKYKSLKSLHPGSSSKILPVRHHYERQNLLQQSQNYGKKKPSHLFVDLNESLGKLDDFYQGILYQNHTEQDKTEKKATLKDLNHHPPVSYMDKSYLLNTKEIQEKKQRSIVQQAHYVERITGNNQSHLAKKLMQNPRNMKIMAPLALKRQGKDMDLLADQHFQRKFL